jgi:hypothetical protein
MRVIVEGQTYPDVKDALERAYYQVQCSESEGKPPAELLDLSEQKAESAARIAEIQSELATLKAKRAKTVAAIEFRQEYISEMCANGIEHETAVQMAAAHEQGEL